MPRQFAAELKAGQTVREVFLLAEARLGQARNGPFWTLRLQDATGRVEAKIWSPKSEAYPELKAGRIVRVEGEAQTYKGQLQLNIERLSLLDPDAPDFDLAELVPASREKPAVLLARIEDLCRVHLTHQPWRDLTSRVFADPSIREKLLAATGAKAMHHAYVGGLLEHTLAVSELCMSFCDHYPQLDREILLTSAVFHDLGKAWELTAQPTMDYTDEGRLLGHIFLGLQVLEPFLVASGVAPGLVMHLKHIILAHHGEYEFGSPRRPKTSEAFALHFADNLDAKMNQIARTLDEQVPLNNEAPDEDNPGWTQYQRSLERYLYRPSRTPAPGEKAKAPMPPAPWDDVPALEPAAAPGPAVSTGPTGPAVSAGPAGPAGPAVETGSAISTGAAVSTGAPLAPRAPLSRPEPRTASSAAWCAPIAPGFADAPPNDDLPPLDAEPAHAAPFSDEPPPWEDADLPPQPEAVSAPPDWEEPLPWDDPDAETTPRAATTAAPFVDATGPLLGPPRSEAQKTLKTESQCSLLLKA